MNPGLPRDRRGYSPLYYLGRPDVELKLNDLPGLVQSVSGNSNAVYNGAVVNHSLGKLEVSGSNQGL